MNEFGVNINVAEFRGNKKWSDRIAGCFLSQGKLWNDAMEKRVKLVVANEISEEVDTVLNEHKRSSMDALVTSLETLLS